MPVTLAVALAVLATTGPPSGLSAEGHALWNLDALLHDTFGARPVCVPSSTRRFNLTTGPCGPLSAFSPYFPTFVAARHSAYHLTSRNVLKMDFGNYPAPVLVRGRGVACNRVETRFLVELSDAASFTLDCLAPHP